MMPCPRTVRGSGIAFLLLGTLTASAQQPAASADRSMPFNAVVETRILPQAAALLARSGEADPALALLAEEAAKLLAQRPWSIERATRAVESYEAAVLSRSGRR